MRSQHKIIKPIQLQLMRGFVRALPLVCDGKILRHGWIEASWPNCHGQICKSGVNVLLHKDFSGIYQGEDGEWYSKSFRGVPLRENTKAHPASEVYFFLQATSAFNIDVVEPHFLAVAVDAGPVRVRTRVLHGAPRRVFSKQQPCGTSSGGPNPGGPTFPGS